MESLSMFVQRQDCPPINPLMEREGSKFEGAGTSGIVMLLDQVPIVREDPQNSLAIGTVRQQRVNSSIKLMWIAAPSWKLRGRNWPRCSVRYPWSYTYVSKSVLVDREYCRTKSNDRSHGASQCQPLRSLEVAQVNTRGEVAKSAFFPCGTFFGVTHD